MFTFTYKLAGFLLSLLFINLGLSANQETYIEVGIAQVDVTPSEPIFLAGYAARRKPRRCFRRFKTSCSRVARWGSAPR